MKLTLNLASKKHLDRQTVYVAYGVILAFLGMLLLLNLNTVIRGQMQVSTLRGHLSKLEDDAGKGAKGALAVSPARMQQTQDEVAFANELLEKDSFRWTEMLNHLEEVVRRGISIRSISPDYKEGGLKVSGLARDGKTLRQFIDRIEASDHFAEVFLFRQANVEVDYRKRKRRAVSFSLELKGVF